MSKLIDKLKLSSQTVPQAMGFRPTYPAPAKPTMLLIASLTQANVDGLIDYVSGADAGLLHISPGSGIKTFQQVSQAMPDIPWGWWLEDSGPGEVEQIAKAGCDFVVFPAASTALAIFPDNEVGRILQIETSLSEGLLRTIDDLPVDAVLVTGKPGEEQFLTWHHLMLFQRFASLSTKPLLVTIPSTVAAKELQVLWETGVDGVIVAVAGKKPAGKLTELRQTIDKLSLSPSRKRGKVRALLPHITEGAGSPTEETEEEEEES